MKKKNPNGFATKTDIQGVKKDIKNVKEELKHDIGIVNKDVSGLKKDVSGLRNDMVGFKDEILMEIMKIRDDNAIIVGRSGITQDELEDHEVRIAKLETNVFANV